MHDPEPSPSARRFPWSAGLLLALALGLGYANSFEAPFVFDDPFLNAERPDLALDYSTRPLVWASFDLNRWLGARDTTSYHAFNWLVHLACALFLLGLVRRGVTRAAPRLSARTGDGLAMATALLWACHPLQTESVTYLSQRAEALGALFTLLTLYGFMRAADGVRPWLWYGVSWLGLGAGFATKETIATAPLLALLFDAMFVSRGLVAALRARAPYYAGLALIALALGARFIGPLLFAERLSAGFKLQEVSALDYARSQPGVILHYLRLAFWPRPLCFDYAWPVARGTTAVVLPLLGIVALALAGVVLALRRSWGGYALLFALVYLLPSSSVVPIRDLAVEHRFYLPLASVALGVACAGHALCARLAWLPLAPLLTGALTTALVAATFVRNRDYATNERLWRVTAEVAPHNARAHGNLGSALLDAGRLEEALAALSKAHELAPEESFILLDLGKVYWKLGHHRRAAQFLERGLARAPDARGLGTLGIVLFEMGDLPGATRRFREALALEPDDPGAHFRLANALLSQQDFTAAEQEFRAALERAPDYEDAHVNYAALLAHLGRTEEALTHTRSALAHEPNSGLEYYNHAQLLLALGRTEEALTSLRAGTRATPDMGEVWQALAEVLEAKPGVSALEREEARQARLRAQALAEPPPR